MDQNADWVPILTWEFLVHVAWLLNQLCQCFQQPQTRFFQVHRQHSSILLWDPWKDGRHRIAHPKHHTCRQATTLQRNSQKTTKAHCPFEAYRHNKNTSLCQLMTFIDPLMLGACFETFILFTISSNLRCYEVPFMRLQILRSSSWTSKSYLKESIRW